MFLNITGECYRVLLRNEEGAWVISCDHPLEPLYIHKANLDRAECMTPPNEYVAAPREDLTPAQQSRYDLIEPLLHDSRYITDRQARRERIKDIALSNNTTERRVRELFFRYLSVGVLTKNKHREPKAYPDYEWAIKTFYLNSKRNSLRMAYDRMILSRYTNTGKDIKTDQIPSWHSFRQYYNRRWRDKEKQKRIARDGLSSYQRNDRMAYGSASMWRNRVGSFQMDAATADLYIVSEYDRSKVIGRPTIILAVDTCTQFIAGIYVGMEGNESAVLSCLSNIAAYKVSYCKSFGIDIEESDWPCHGVMAQELITDKGLEFLGKKIDDFLIRYGAERHALPPFRPDEKGLVEKAIDLLQGCYKPMLRGKGVIEPDAVERWSADYREQAVLTLSEFTKIVIHSVLHLNNGRRIRGVREAGEGLKSPREHWNSLRRQGMENLLPVDEKEVYLTSLPCTEVRMTKKGICFNKLYYAPEKPVNFLVGDKLTVAYDSTDTYRIYIVSTDSRVDISFTPCTLTTACSQYGKYTTEELGLIRKDESRLDAEADRMELESRLLLYKSLQEIIDDGSTAAHEGAGQTLRRVKKG